MACDRGCSLLFSIELAIFINSFSSISEIISVTCGLPSVMVPVLSSKIVSTLWRFSKLSAFLNKSPNWALFPVATIIAIGVASPKAHGQEITKTEIAKFKENSKPYPKIIQTTKVIKEIIITVGTKIAEILSASFAIGAFVSFAWFTSSIIFESVVSSPTFVASNIKEPCLFKVAEITSSPIFLFTGIDSPVIADSSTRDEPSFTIPSTGIASPGLTKIKSPFFKSSTKISTSFLSFKILAFFGARSIKDSKDFFVWPLDFFSKYFPKVIKVKIIADDSKYRLCL